MNELGEVLFDRLGKKIILTNIGKKLVPYAKQMLDIYKEIKISNTMNKLIEITLKNCVRWD